MKKQSIKSITNKTEPERTFSIAVQRILITFVSLILLFLLTVTAMAAEPSDQSLKDIRNAPDSTVYAVKESLSGANDGKIRGLTSEMEYRYEDETTYQKIEEGQVELTGLKPGTYYVRYMENEQYQASPDTELVVISGDMIEVTFDVSGHGTAPSAQGVSLRAKITKPADPVTDGYSFLGWYRDPSCVTEWDFENDTVSEDLTLYAKWVEGKVIIPTGSGVQVDNAAMTKIGEQYSEKYKKELGSSLNSVTVIMDIDKDTVSQNSLDMIREVVGFDKSLEAFEANLMVSVNDGTPVDIGSENDQLITLTCSFDFTGKENIQVYRTHDYGTGTAKDLRVDEISETPNSDGEFLQYNEKEKTIVLGVIQFSTYAIVYETETSVPDTGDDRSIGIYLLAGITALFLIIAMSARISRKH